MYGSPEGQMRTFFLFLVILCWIFCVSDSSEDVEETKFCRMICPSSLIWFFQLWKRVKIFRKKNISGDFLLCFLWETKYKKKFTREKLIWVCFCDTHFDHTRLQCNTSPWSHTLNTTHIYWFIFVVFKWKQNACGIFPHVFTDE